VATVTTREETMEVEEEFSAPVVEAASSAGDAGSSSACDDAPQEESDVVRLQREIELLKVELAECKEKLIEVEKEEEVLLERQFSLDKIKDDDSAILFYTGFPNYGSLIGFYNFIEPKLQKLQYWKGEKLLLEKRASHTRLKIIEKILGLQENSLTWMNFYLCSCD